MPNTGSGKSTSSTRAHIEANNARRLQKKNVRETDDAEAKRRPPASDKDWRGTDLQARVRTPKADHTSFPGGVQKGETKHTRPARYHYGQRHLKTLKPPICRQCIYDPKATKTPQIRGQFDVVIQNKNKAHNEEPPAEAEERR